VNNRHLPLLALLLGAAFGFGADAPVPPAVPTVFWASDPVRPGETVMAFGAGFGAAPTIAVARLANGTAGEPSDQALDWPLAGREATVIQPSDTAVKFTVPPDLKPGVFVYRIAGPPGGAVVGLLNRPAVWWALGDVGSTARPGGWVQLFGKNLVRDKDPQTRVLLRGPQSVSLTPESADAYTAKVNLPADLPVGEYRVFLHNGNGGAAAWSDAVRLVIEVPPVWPQTVFNVRDLGADGSGLTDSTAVVQTALAQAQANGGGVVYFPRGRYQVTAALTIPRCTVLRGEKQELACLFWPDLQDPPPAWLVGSNSFGCEDITLYCSNYKTLLSADTQGDDAGDVALRRVRVRANLYRGHMVPEEVDRRYRAGLGGFGGGYWLATLGGRNVEVTDCDLTSSGCTIKLTRVRGARMERNTFDLGRLGGCGVFEGEGLLLADNQFVGSDLTAACGAGGLGYGNLSNLCLLRNRFSLLYGMNGEAITSDAPGGIYAGPLVGGDSTGVTLPAALAGNDPGRRGAAVYVVAGTGVGQWRRVASAEGQRVVVDVPWQVPPDATSTVAIAWLLHHWLVLNNDFADVGIAIQFYGAALEHIAAGNRCVRSAGFHNFGMNYNGVQPSWFVQWLDNEISEGNIYRADHDQIRLSGDSHLGVYGLIGGDWRLPITVGTVLRRNRLHNNASIVLGSEARSARPVPLGRTDPLVTGVVVEDNTLENCDLGVCIFQTAQSVWLANNSFRNVKQELWDETAALAEQEARRQELMASPGPIAVWDFGKALAATSGAIQRVPDASGHGFDADGTAVRLVTDTTKGQVAAFAGDGYLRVDDRAMFNLQDATFSLWINPDTVEGRQGLLSKRFMATAAPYMLSLWDGGLEFEGNDEKGEWSFIFRVPADIKPGVWTHVAAVIEVGKGVAVYRNGDVVGRKDNPLRHCANAEPLILGREAWCGLPGQQDPPAGFRGRMGEVKLWARALAPAEVQAESRQGAAPP
jgi:hypothetical protein